MAGQNETSSDAYKIKVFLLQALSYKYIYIATIIICFAVAYIVNKYSTVVYEVNSIIGPVDNKRTSLLGSDNLFSGLGAYAEVRNLENDINTLKSFSLVTTTLNKMNLEVGYFTEKNRIFSQPQENYPSSHYIVSIDKSHVQPLYARFYVDILDEFSFRLTASEEDVPLYNYLDNKTISHYYNFKIDTICRFNETISNKNFKFAVGLNEEDISDNLKDESLNYFQLYNLDNLTKLYLGRIKVEPISLKSSLIKIRLQGKNIGLIIDFLNKYLQTYLDDNLSKKNKISVNTINFIDSQISEISDSLIISETKLRDYRSANLVTDLSYQGQQALSQMTQIENERSTLQVQERYYNYILSYFNKNQDIAGLAPPSAANVVDPIMNTLVLDLLALNSQRSTILSNNAEKNLFLGQLEYKIKLQKQTIIDNVKNNLNTLNLTQNELNYRADKISREISRLPRTELNMVSMQRKFNLSDAIYTFLLQKRSEAAITMASNYPDYEILEPARSITKSILSPRTRFNWLIAFFLSFMLPTLLVIAKNFFNEKITTINEVEHLLDRSVLSVIYSNQYKTDAVVHESPGSSIAESFRNLRSSLFLKFRKEPLKVIMVTSSQPQDGKSFIAFNLASSIASVGYKSLILDCDLRCPTLHEKLKMENTFGLSNYMADHTPKEEIIRKTNIENLSFIPAGPLLPNSSELIEAGVLDELIDFLKSKYDYVIIDTTPSGIVADAALIVKYASHILLVCRNNFTRREALNDVLNMYRANRIENFDVVYNDLNIKKSRYGRYNNYFKKERSSIIP
jgi:capsular exopolysaccharide synthesis family protein